MIPDDIPLSDLQLKQATSRALPDGSVLDPETASLREGFLALGAAVEAAGGQVDEAALIRQLQQPAITQVSLRTRPSSPSQVWPLVLGGALALAGLVATVRIVQQWPISPSVAAAPGIDDQANVAPVASPSPRGWFDPLDDEIAVAQIAMDHFASHRGGMDGSLSQFGQELGALAAELSHESL